MKTSSSCIPAAASSLFAYPTIFSTDPDSREIQLHLFAPRLSFARKRWSEIFGPSFLNKAPKTGNEPPGDQIPYSTNRSRSRKRSRTTGIEQALSRCCAPAACIDTIRSPDETAEAAQCSNSEYAAYMGQRYCLACTSGGYALQVSRSRPRVCRPGDAVLSNAFTLAPVPGAIDNAGGKAGAGRD